MSAVIEQTLTDGRLTLKMQRFVEFYVGEARFNATKAARLAGYKGNAAVLAAVGYENLRKPQIVALVQARLNEAHMSADQCLSELADIAMADWREFVEIKHDKNGDIIEANLRLTDKLKALELIGKHHKLFTDKVETTNELSDKQQRHYDKMLTDALTAAIDSGELSPKDAAGQHQRGANGQFVADPAQLDAYRQRLVKHMIASNERAEPYLSGYLELGKIG